MDALLWSAAVKPLVSCGAQYWSAAVKPLVSCGAQFWSVVALIFGQQGSNLWSAAAQALVNSRSALVSSSETFRELVHVHESDDAVISVAIPYGC